MLLSYATLNLSVLLQVVPILSLALLYQTSLQRSGDLKTENMAEVQYLIDDTPALQILKKETLGFLV